MRWKVRTWMTLAAINGFIAVAMGAFATHGLANAQAREWAHIGATYGFMHTMTTFACATFMRVGAERARYAPPFFLSGVAVFSGSLYAMALGAPRWLGAVTPIGGLLFLAGWGTLAWAAATMEPSQA